MNINDLISHYARATPDADAIVEQGRSISYRELERRVACIAAGLVEAGVEPGRIVGVSFARIDPTSVLLALALGRMGAVSVPLSIEHPAEARAAQSAQFEIDTVIAEHPQYAIEGRRFVQFDPGWVQAGGTGLLLQESFERPRWPWRMHVSSGTTTHRLKGVLESHNSLGLQAISGKACGLAPAGARLVPGLPMTVASGIRACLRALMGGNAVIFPRSLATADLAEAIDRYRATDAMLMQITVQDLLRTLPTGRRHFPGLQRVIVGGFATPPGLVEEMAERIAPQVRVLYGATEVGVIAFADLQDLRRAPGSVGRPVPGVKVQVVDEHDAPCRPGETGIVRVRSIALAGEYFKDPESTQKVFRDGWVYPGDYGRIDAEGYIWLETRVDDVRKVVGRNIDLATIDRVLNAHPQVAEAAAYTVVTPTADTEVHAAVVPRATPNGTNLSGIPGVLDEAALLLYCQSRLESWEIPTRLLLVRALPRNEGGKVMRHALLRMAGSANPRQ